jgi:hypothetical protein
MRAFALIGLVACGASPAAASDPVASAPPRADIAGVRCGIKTPSTDGTAVELYCGQVHDGCCLPDGAGWQWNCNNVSYIEWFTKHWAADELHNLRLYCDHVHDRCCDSGWAWDCKKTRYIEWYTAHCSH